MIIAEPIQTSHKKPLPQKNVNLLFLYMVPDTGHHKAAEALIYTNESQGFPGKCTGIDVAQQTLPTIGPLFNKLYLKMLRFTPFVWYFIYDNPYVEFLTRYIRKTLFRLTHPHLQSFINKYNPSAVVCTQAIPALALAHEKRRKKLNIPLIGVITDFRVHIYWVQNEIDLFLVPHPETKNELIERGIPANKIAVTGLPIHPKFQREVSKDSIRQLWGLNPNKKTVLIMGGGQGLGRMDKIINALHSLESRIQIMVLCGRNNRMKKKLEIQYKKSANTYILGYQEDTSDLMSVADLLITKPGGMTCSEALVKNVPLLLVNPLPGQETRNTQFLMRHGAARLAHSESDLLKIVKECLDNPDTINQMKIKSLILAKPHASSLAVNRIRKLLEVV